LTIQATLCFILKDSSVLLLKKSPGLFGQGKWNAPGGKILPNEEPKKCVVREVFEETRLIVRNIEQVSLLLLLQEQPTREP
jgi:8-oxo-dGTP pyrophosphatase MutT (NUDIX family)